MNLELGYIVESTLVNGCFKLCYTSCHWFPFLILIIPTDISVSFWWYSNCKQSCLSPGWEQLA